MVAEQSGGSPFIIAALVVLCACDESQGDVCVPGAVEACSCGAGEGFSSRRCRDDGTGWDPCECSGADGDADTDAESDADEDEGGDADLEALPGPLVQVSDTIAMSPEEACDVDGDGTLDNSVADLGADLAAVFALAFNTLLEDSFESGERIVFHAPWIDDLRGPSDDDFTSAGFIAWDTDRPADASDDHSGHEPFFAGALSLDSCGEPPYQVEGMRLDRGVISGGTGSLVLPLPPLSARFNVSEVTGVMAPLGASFELQACGYIAAQELGGASGTPRSGLSYLEVFLAGGTPLGVHSIPGVQLDIDLDGDGVERILLDDEFHVTTCVDGDATIIEGRDCWRDPRIADAFSLTIVIAGTSARYAGREPGWEYMVPPGCPDGPSDESFFDTIPASGGACSGLDEQCDPLAVAPCCDSAHTCSGADLSTYRCYPPCAESRCFDGLVLGTCYMPADYDEPLCDPFATLTGRAACSPGDAGCTTAHGATDDTVCVDRADSGRCFVRCSAPAAPCGPERRCVPLPFEDGGVCAYEPGAAPG